MATPHYRDAESNIVNQMAGILEELGSNQTAALLSSKSLSPVNIVEYVNMVQDFAYGIKMIFEESGLCPDSIQQLDSFLEDVSDTDLTDAEVVNSNSWKEVQFLAQLALADVMGLSLYSKSQTSALRFNRHGEKGYLFSDL